MQVTVRNELDENQSRILVAAYDVAWHRMTKAEVLVRLQPEFASKILCDHLSRLVRRGEHKVERLAMRGVFLICGILACPHHQYIPDRPLQTDGAVIVY